MSYIAKNGRLYTSGASEALTLLDDKFSVNKSYSKGDSCIYNDYLWKFTSDKPAGEWNPSVVEQCRIMDFVNDVNNDLIFNNIYKCRNLGTISSSNVDAWIAKHINSDGTFNDIYVGDVVTIQDGTYNAKWVVAGFDTELNKGDTALATHHISLIPQTYLFTAPMNDTDTTAGGYAGSKMHKTTLVTVANNLKNALGSHLLERRVLLSNSVNTSIASGAGAGYTGASNNWGWFSAFCTLLTEVQVYGSRVLSSSSYDIGEGCSQLPLFKFVNHVYHGRFNFWLRAVASSTTFARAGANGNTDNGRASNANAVRPLITIG
jgi:hypothetical protein